MLAAFQGLFEFFQVLLSTVFTIILYSTAVLFSEFNQAYSTKGLQL